MNVECQWRVVSYLNSSLSIRLSRVHWAIKQTITAMFGAVTSDAWVEYE